MTKTERWIPTTLAGMAALIVGMSISRFAYTPILPVMLDAGAIDHTQGALLASANLLGYLVGAIPAGAPALRNHLAAVLKISLIVNVAMLAAMLVPHNIGAWYAARFISGVTSAFVFVFASTMVLALGRAAATTALFSAVGLGIMITGLLIPFCYGLSPAWETGWTASALLGIALTLVVVIMARTPQHKALQGADHTHASKSGNQARAFWSICAAYGLAGFSYVVPATFLVAILSADPLSRSFAPWSWTIVGACAALSIGAWSALSARFGKPATLTVSLLVLAIGCAAPALVHNAGGPFTGAFGLGASFMAISMLCVALVRDLEPARASTRIAVATVIFSIGQFLGPIFTAYTYARTHEYSLAMIVAAIVLGIAAVVVILGLGLAGEHRSGNAARKYTGRDTFAS